MIGINSEDPPTAIANFVATHGLTFPILRDDQPWATTGHYGVRSWSEFRLLRKEGDRVRFRILDREGNPVTPEYSYFDPDLIDRLLKALERSDS